jgi:DNA-binding response OmpR family regulator
MFQKLTVSAILIVDDELELGALYARGLQAAGHRAVTESCPNAALTRFAAQRFDLVVTDVRMPTMNGFVLAARAWELRPTVPVLFISGHLEHTPPVAGFYDILAKPFTPAQFVAAVERLCRAPAALG